MLRLIDQFLEEEGMGATRQTLAEEWTGKARERGEAEADARKLRKAILGKERRASLLAKSYSERAFASRGSMGRGRKTTHEATGTERQCVPICRLQATISRTH